MYIFIMRHGEAEPLSDKDEKRLLTSIGQRQAREAGKWIQQFLEQHASGEVQIDLALVSPYKRTRQTFEGVRKSLKVENIQYSEDVVPLGNPQLVQDYLEAVIASKPDYQALLIVSHMPLVSYLPDVLCRQLYSMLFATGSVCALHWDPQLNLAKLVEMWHPQN